MVADSFPHSVRIVASLLLTLLCLAAAPGVRADSCANSLGRALPEFREAALGSEFEVLSWNIQKASNQGWDTDLASLGAGIDLAFIQEASLQAQLDEIIPGPLHRAFAQGYSRPGSSTGVMTLSTRAPSGRCQVTAWEPWLGTPKAVSITEHPLRDRDERLLAINVHAVNFELGLESFSAQFQALGAVLDLHRGPVILAGDLNTWNGGRQALVERFTREYGLASVAFQPDLRTRAFGRALDHIYVRGLASTEARVIPVSSSDHNPLRVRLALN